MLTPELKKGSAEFLVLSLLEHEPRHGYDLSKLIASRSRGVLTFHVASLYPLLYRMEARGWIRGRWGTTEKNRQARFYAITAAGRRQLAQEQESWERLTDGVSRVLRFA